MVDEAKVGVEIGVIIDPEVEAAVRVEIGVAVAVGIWIWVALGVGVGLPSFAVRTVVKFRTAGFPMAFPSVSIF
jgi:hypothetical protein